MTFRSLVRPFAAAALLAAVTFIPQTASAQLSCNLSPSCSVNHTVNLNVPAVLRLTLGAASTTISPTAAEVIAGASSDVAGPSVQVLSNRLFSLSVETTTATWTAPVGITKAASDLQYAFDGTTFVGLSTTPLSLVTGGARGVSNYTAGNFRVLLNAANDGDGAYSIVTRFTVSAP